MYIRTKFGRRQPPIDSDLTKSLLAGQSDSKKLKNRVLEPQILGLVYPDFGFQQSEAD